MGFIVFCESGDDSDEGVCVVDVVGEYDVGDVDGGVGFGLL